ncbi:MAG: hypothetical protein H6510_06390 [Acidobacteria bacterium]|nr:hypothetical protein [Acidobacteriota bacterium]MCB9397424.1 hypothetical protein [Acidobacteriota bacterium]
MLRTHACLRLLLFFLWAGILLAQSSTKVGILSAPTFITEQDIWINEDNRLEILLPHPNSDGYDPSGGANLQYRIKILLGCEVYYNTTVKRSSWPTIWKNFFEIPFDDYQIQISRETTIGKTAPPPSSPGTVLVGPNGGTPAELVPTNHLEIKRWTLHVPKIGGGFEGSLSFNNRFPDLPATIYTAGFDAQGNLISGTVKSVTVIGQRPVIPVYARQAGQSALYDMTMTDKISHIGWFEPMNRHFVSVSISYKNLAENALAATIAETDLEAPEQTGEAFVLEARKSGNFWDGVAILNLTSTQTAQITAYQRSLETGDILQSTPLGSLGPGRKLLSVLSEVFPLSGNAYYTIESDQAEIQVLGLRGSLTAQPALLVGSQVFKNR